MRKVHLISMAGAALVLLLIASCPAGSVIALNGRNAAAAVLADQGAEVGAGATS